MCILYNQQDATCTVFFIIISAQHVSGGFPAHHQELIKLYVQPWVLSCFPAVYRWCRCVGMHILNSSNTSTPAIDSRKAWQYPRLNIQFYKLMMMGRKTARNMYSADNNKEHCIIRCMCDRASYMKMTRGTNLMKQLWFIIINSSTCFGHLYVHLQECRLCTTAYGVQHCKR